MLRQAMRRWMAEEPTKREKEAVAADKLLLIWDALEKPLDDHTLMRWTVILFGYCFGCRIGDYLIDRPANAGSKTHGIRDSSQDILVLKDRVKVTLRRTKTTHGKALVKVIQRPLGSPLDVGHWINEIRARKSILPNKDNQFFRHPSTGVACTSRYGTKFLRQLLALTDLDPWVHTAHGLRKGCSQDLADAGVTVSDILALVGWKSVRSFDRYASNKSAAQIRASTCVNARTLGWFQGLSG